MPSLEKIDAVFIPTGVNDAPVLAAAVDEIAEKDRLAPPHIRDIAGQRSAVNRLVDAVNPFIT